MRERSIDAVALAIFCRDFDQNWYVSNFTLEQNAAAVSSIDVIRKKAAGGQVEVIHKIHFSPKTPALEILCKHLGLFDERDPNEGQPDVPAFILPPGSKVSIT